MEPHFLTSNHYQLVLRHVARTSKLCPPPSLVASPYLHSKDKLETIFRRTPEKGSDLHTFIYRPNGVFYF